MRYDREAVKFERGIFLLSLDFELIWGTADLDLPDFVRQCRLERRFAIDRLLDLFELHDIRATWAVLGHLFLSRCEPVGGRAHPEIVRPQFSWVKADWFWHDPGGAESDESIHLGRSLVDKIRSCAVRQEIGSHSFCHVIFGDPGCSRETAETDVAECVRIAQEQGLQLKSFVFPRNEIGYLDVLKKHGFSCYRGAEPHWYEHRTIPEMIRRGFRLFDVLRGASPPTVVPSVTESGLVNIPGSAMFFPMHGFRRHIPMSVRVKRCIKGLERAARRREIFHLWFHPTNMVAEMETMFSGLNEILTHVSQLRKAGVLDVMTMAEVSARFENEGKRSLSTQSGCGPN
jgi:peptidoglycan/xylan/chitin deacetylase (PgdA/CDA1 family)